MGLRTIKCRQVRQINGKLYARFTDKSELEFDSRADMKRWIRNTLDDRVMKALVLSAVLEDSDGVPLRDADAKRITLDFSASPPLKVVQE